jgi:hypothetical protein
MRIILSIIFLLTSISALAQSDKCYPGLDCPKDIPGRPTINENPPPTVRPVPTPQPNENCTNPYAAVINQLFLGVQSNCSQPATHCCFEDGSALPLDRPRSIKFGDLCHTNLNYMGIVQLPVQGMGCCR